MTTGRRWEYHRYDPRTERLVESLCTLGNGRFATRGSAPESVADDIHYPGTYLAGCYNRLDSTVGGRTVSNEDMVRLPDWTALRYRCLPEGAPPGDWLTPDHPSLRHSRVSLDLRAGTLTRRMLFHDADGRRLGVTHTRLVHMGDPNLAAQSTVFRAYGWSGRIEIESLLDGDVTNAGVDRYRALAGRHLVEHRAGVQAEGTAWLSCATTTSRVRIGLAVRTSMRPRAPVRVACTATTASQTFLPPIERAAPVVVVKTAALCSSLDRPVADPLRRSIDCATHAPDFPSLLASHRASWQRLWSEGELNVPGETGKVLRLHAFHVLQTLSPHTAELDAGVPARGLHGEAYRGHVFWDELFVLPYLALHFPETARGLLTYRHRRLRAALEAARRAGAKGAMFPWQSGSSGYEETQRLHLNPRSGRWLPDHSHLQRHVGSAIAWNVWQYGRATGDAGFMHGAGAELLLHIAHFWADAATWDTGLDRYRIRGVVGPDEYHDGYPGAATAGIDDNTYTNVTAAWVLARALDLYGELPAARRAELLTRLGIGPDDLTVWEDVSRRLFVPFHRDVISQFDGYGDLAELDWDGYRARYHDIRRLDRILEAEGDTPNRYQASKQADTLMLGYLFRPTELEQVFLRLGYHLDDGLWRRTVDYYLRRTCHGSTLSSLVHGWVLAREQGPDAWRYCQEALLSDITDVQGGTTGEGIHLGAMGGTLDLVERGIVGLESRGDGLHIDPVPLSAVPGSSFSICRLGHRDVRVRFRPGRLGISVPPSARGPVPLVLPGGRQERVSAGQERWFRLPGG
ncbi:MULTISPECIES: glycoside hydrolase family 65 protein [Streptomyces]|uniref:glycoside hydrolase family 65 protein n=1 Tax=Streptomyces TaxID=1883 RepID=UPI0006B002DF|nr:MULTISPECIES: glycoside hydrolase family 65 protein [unclassified Streptomyces]KOU93244.1 trehalose 6-phosphate phosphorylase [Streptomyces sp. XY533]MCI4079852.1 glycoside hydrolase family 65 protein [Streptomyces sp. MMS21 TC-5]